MIPVISQNMQYMTDKSRKLTIWRRNFTFKFQYTLYLKYKSRWNQKR